MDLILASQSPRRRKFLHDLGLTFSSLATDIDETPLAGEAPAALALRLAEAKARAAAAIVAARMKVADAESSMRREPLTLRTDPLILASDTVVAVEDEILGKPSDEDDAIRMLVRLRAAPHFVYTATCALALSDGPCHSRLNQTRVTMRAYTDAEILAYVATGDPMDKAGGYAIQHADFAPVAALDGCYTSVMGLPLGDVRDLLAQFNIEIPRTVSAVCQQQAPEVVCCQAEFGNHRV